MNQVIYINGVKYHTEWNGDGFYADHPDLPFSRCSFHRMDKSDYNLILSGQGNIITGANVYSIKGD